MLAIYSSNAPSQRDGMLYWALGLSITLHIIVLALLVPRMRLDSPSTEQQPMTVELLAARPTELPVSAANPVPVEETPLPVEPKPVTKVKTAVRPKPLLPSPTLTNQPAEIVPPSPPVAESKPAPETTAQSNTEAKSATSAATLNTESAHEAAQPSTPSVQNTDDARNQYGAWLTRAIAKYKQYPAIAQRRGWEGDVILELQLDGNGNMLSYHIYQSSNREPLDAQALEMVRKASPFPLPPQSLRGRSFTILVPVGFKLE